MIRAAIIEDEALAVQNLKQLLSRTAPDVQVLQAIDNVQEAVQWLQQNTVDLLFLDIHLGDNLSFRIFEELPLKTPVIFTTAYDKYALHAFKLNSIDYLLKPVQPDELSFAINKYRAQQLPAGFDVQALLSALKPQPAYQERFMVVAGQKIKSIPVQEVAYFMAEGRYVKLVTDSNERHLLNQSLESVQAKTNPDDFFRINRQLLVRFGSIATMHLWSKSRVKLELRPDPGTDTIVSIDKSGEFKQWLDR